MKPVHKMKYDISSFETMIPCCSNFTFIIIQATRFTFIIFLPNELGIHKNIKTVLFDMIENIKSNYKGR